MNPHPSFANREIPSTHPLGDFVLKNLTIKDLDRDYAAVMHSASEIRAASPNSDWPSMDMTIEENMIDLAWHQREFMARRSFAYVIEDTGGTYLGCAYVYPSIAGENTADVPMWWKTGVEADRLAFRNLLFDWLEGDDWPDLEYRPADMT